MGVSPMLPWVERRYTFSRSHRLRSKLEFSAVFESGLRVSRGPLTLLGRPNDLTHPRMGLSIPRRVGTAARRNRVKRMLRESFRLMQHDLPAGYDFVIVVRPHEPMILAEYQRLLSALVVKLHQSWQERPPPPSGA